VSVCWEDLRTLGDDVPVRLDLEGLSFAAALSAVQEGVPGAYEAVNQHVQLLEESSRRHEAYAHSAAHDLRSPLRRIRSFAQILQARLEVNEIDRVQLSDFADRISHGAERLDVLLESMLAHASIDTLEVEPIEHADLQAVAQNVCDGIIELSLEPVPTFVVTGLPEVRLPVDAAERVLRNLIDNALKYSASDRAAIVEIVSEPSGDGIRVRVSDNGIGIEPEQAEQIFQQSRERNDRAAGSGTGLAVVEQLLTRSGAKIWLESKASPGASFVIEFPAAAIRPESLMSRVRVEEA